MGGERKVQKDLETFLSISVFSSREQEYKEAISRTVHER